MGLGVRVETGERRKAVSDRTNLCEEVFVCGAVKIKDQTQCAYYFESGDNSDSHQFVICRWFKFGGCTCAEAQQAAKGESDE